MKKLAIKEIPNENGEITKIQIIEQTHRGRNFGKDGRCSFLHDNGFLLSSRGQPQEVNKNLLDKENNEEIGNVYYGLYVRGSTNQCDENILIVPSNTWLEDMREAVRSYNEHFCTCKDCTYRKCNGCPADK
jgi:hypothetical protein